ncbi:MAG: hypothetical protein J6U01_05195 [Clostridia bacterium]|nr:hypothetical protein [Clostridia bacterium]
MKKTVSLILTVVMILCLAGSAAAETGFETLFGFYTTEECFGEPAAVYDYQSEEGEGEKEAKVCLAIFLFDQEYDMTTAILIGKNKDGEEKYYQWTADLQPGFATMVTLLANFEMLKSRCEDGVDFCISFSADAGATMTDIDTAEKAKEYLARLETSSEPAKAE